MFDDWGDVLQPVLTGTIVGGAGLWLGDLAQRRGLRRQMASGQIVLSARSPDGTHPVLSPLWQTHRATPRPGRLDLRHWVLPDDVTSVTVTALDVGERHPGLLERWRLNVSDARVLAARTPEGVVELAVAARQVAWLRDQLTGDRDARG